MRSLALAVLLLVVSLPAFAQIGAASYGRGNTGYAITNEDSTGLANPAALPRLGMWSGDAWVQDGDKGPDAPNWGMIAGYSQDLNSWSNDWALQMAAKRRDNKAWGIGLGFISSDSGDMKSWYASFGKEFSNKCNKWSWGITAELPKSVSGPDYVTFDAGLLYAAPTQMFGGATWSFGLIGRDILNAYGVAKPGNHGEQSK